MKYVIGTGWWCTDEPSWGPERKRLGDDLIRTARFHELWYESVNRFADPHKILIVDSASPVRPPVREGDRRIAGQPQRVAGATREIRCSSS